MVISKLKVQIRDARALDSPAMQKWAGFESQAFAMLIIGLIVVALMIYCNYFFPEIFISGCCVGVLISAVYFFSVTSKPQAALFTFLAFVLLSVITASINNFIPLYIMGLNGFGGGAIVVGFIAAWTRGVKH